MATSMFNRTAMGRSKVYAVTRHTRAWTVPVALSLVCMPLWTGCDGNEAAPLCQALSTDVYATSASFKDRQSGQDLAEFELQQTVITYEAGDCQEPTGGKGEVRLIVKNLTMCNLDISYSLSVFEGRNGWTVEDDVDVAPGAARDAGIIYTAVSPQIDQTQKILMGSAVRTGCL